MVLQLPYFPPYVHFLCEALACAAAAGLYVGLRRREDILEPQTRSSLLVGCLLGAAVGSRSIVWLESPHLFWAELRDFQLLTLLSGKGMVGGLAGGIIGTEAAKKLIGVTTRTGDLFALPLCLAVIIGRVGCFLTGLADRTYGSPSDLPWAVDFGDGVSRHPTQVYEIVAVSLLLFFLLWRRRFPYPQGALFRFFVLGYLAFRFAVQFIKPTPHIYAGLDIIQVISLILCTLYASQLRHLWPGRSR